MEERGDGLLGKGVHLIGICRSGLPRNPNLVYIISLECIWNVIPDNSIKMEVVEEFTCEGCKKKFVSKGGKRKHNLFHHPELMGLDTEEIDRQRATIRSSWKKKGNSTKMVRGNPQIPSLSPSSEDLPVDQPDMEAISPALPEPGYLLVSTSQMDALQEYVKGHPACNFQEKRVDLEALIGRRFGEEEFEAVTFALRFLDHHLEKSKNVALPQPPSVPSSAVFSVDAEIPDWDETDDLSQYLCPGYGSNIALDPFLWNDL